MSQRSKTSAPTCLVFLALFLFRTSTAQSQGTFGIILDTPGPHTVSSLGIGVREFGLNLTGINSRNDAQVVIPGNASISVNKTGVGNLFGLHASDQSTIEIRPTGNPRQIDLEEDFIGNATGLIATQQGTINYTGRLFLDSDGNGDAFLAVGRDNASLILGGNSRLVQSGNGGSTGVLVSEFAKVMLIGQISLTDSGNDGAVLVNAGDQSNSMLAGTGTVLDLGNGNAVGILAHGNSTITLSGNYRINEEGNGDSLLVVARDSSSTLLDGEFIGSNDGNSGGMSPIQLNDFARLNFVGGRVRNEWLSRGAVDAVSLTGQSFMNWTGGELESISRGNALVPSVSVAQESILIVSGTSFNRPYGPVTELTGSISGVLQDGSPVEFDFQRGIDATILLVPEPSCSSIAGLALVLMTQLRQGTRAFAYARP